MADILRYLGQAVVYGGTALLFAVFSNAPSYEHFPPDQAAVRISIIHGAQRKEKCRRLTAQEIADLPPNMRKPTLCSRERLPVWLEVSLDGAVVVARALPPTGLSGDGPSRLDQRFAVTPGPHKLRLRMRDSGRAEGYDYELEREIELQPQQNLVIDFRPEQGGFILL